MSAGAKVMKTSSIDVQLLAPPPPPKGAGKGAKNGKKVGRRGELFRISEKRSTVGV